MFSRDFRRNTESVGGFAIPQDHHIRGKVQDENTGNPVIPQVQGSSSEISDDQFSSSKRKVDPLENAGTTSLAKYEKFQLKSENHGTWLPIERRRRLEKRF